MYIDGDWGMVEMIGLLFLERHVSALCGLEEEVLR
jgi:hypothetical protein